MIRYNSFISLQIQFEEGRPALNGRENWIYVLLISNHYLNQNETLHTFQPDNHVFGSFFG